MRVVKTKRQRYMETDTKNYVEEREDRKRQRRDRQRDAIVTHIYEKEWVKIKMQEIQRRELEYQIFFHLHKD